MNKSPEIKCTVYHYEIPYSSEIHVNFPTVEKRLKVLLIILVLTF